MRMFLLCGLIAVTGCANSIAQTQPTTRPFVVGRLDAPPIKESSGIVESRKHPGVFWTHNDSGNAAVLYAVRRDGSLINAFPVKCVMFDWEDIAVDGEGHLYVADTGNNGLFRESLGILKIDEPDPNVAPDPKRPLVPTQTLAVRFDQGKRMDVESFFVFKGDGFLIRKSTDGSPTTMWKFALQAKGVQTLQIVATLPVQAICTGADLSADGDRLAVMSVDGPYLFAGLGGDLSRVESTPPAFVRIERRTNEAVCFTQDGLLSTNEQRDVYFFPFDAFGGR